MHRRVQVVGWSLIWTGFFVMGYVGWQVVVTDWLNRGVQVEAQGELSTAIAERPSFTESIPVGDLIGDRPPPPEAPPEFDFTPEQGPDRGESFAFIRVPKIDVERVVFSGVDVNTLRSGPGHMIGTPVPGQPGNAVISGHRTTYGAPFHDLDLLEEGDLIEVETFSGVHVYEVRESFIVLPTDVWVTDPKEGGWLTLTTCNPKFSARERLIIQAELVESPNLEYIEFQASLNTNPEEDET